MPKLIAPMFSVAASGTLGHRLTYYTAGSVQTVRWNATHHPPRSVLQTAHGARVADCRASWRLLPQVDKDEWNACFSWIHLTGPALFMREWFAQDIYPPALPVVPVV